MIDPLRHHRKQLDQPLMGDSFAERVSEKVASGMGTVGFLIVSSLLIIAWVVSNGLFAYVSHTFHAITHGSEFDPEPWILLNLIFSAVAFYTGALVIISQKAGAKRDRATAQADALHREELNEKLMTLIGDNTALTEQVHALAQEIRSATATR